MLEVSKHVINIVLKGNKVSEAVRLEVVLVADVARAHLNKRR